MKLNKKKISKFLNSDIIFKSILLLQLYFDLKFKFYILLCQTLLKEPNNDAEEDNRNLEHK